MNAPEEVPMSSLIVDDSKEDDGLSCFDQESSDSKGIGCKSITQMLSTIEALIGKHHHSDMDEEAVIERLMKNMERLDEDFHKHHLVRYIYHRIEQTMKSDISQMVDQAVEGLPEVQIMNELTCSSRFCNLETDILLQLEKATNQLICSDFAANRTISILSSEDSSVCGSEYSWESFTFNNTRQSTPMRRRRAANNLNIRNSVEVRLKGIDDLQQMFAGDIVANEHWDFILESLSTALGDPDTRIVTKCLDLLKTLFKVSPPEVTGEIYLSVVNHLLMLFRGSPSNYQIHYLSNEDPVFRITLKRFRLLSYLMNELPKHWIQFRDSLLSQIFSTTFTLFTLNLPDDLRSDMIILYPFAYLTLVDENCRWFLTWTKDSWARKYFGTALKSSELFRLLSTLIGNTIQHKSREDLFDVQKIKDFYSHIDHVNYLRPQFELPNRLIYLVLNHSLLLVGKVVAYSETCRVAENDPENVMWQAVLCLLDMLSGSITGTKSYKRLASTIVTVLLDNLKKKPNIDIIRAALLPLRSLYVLLEEHVIKSKYFRKYRGVRRALRVTSDVIAELLNDKCLAIYIVQNSTLTTSSLQSETDVIAELLYFFQHLFSNTKDQIAAIVPDRLRQGLEQVFIILIAHTNLTQHISTLESIASLLSEREENKHILVQFARHSQGLQILRKLGTLHACAESLVDISTRQNFSPSLCYIFSQFSTIPEILEGFAKTNFFHHLLEGAYERVIAYEWIPDSDRKLSIFERPHEEVDLLFLLLSTPYLIPIMYEYNKQTLDRIIRTISEEAIGSCQEMRQEHYASFSLQIIIHSTNQLDNVVFLEEFYSLVSLFSLKSTTNSIIDENYFLSNIIHTRFWFMGGDRERIVNEHQHWTVIPNQQQDVSSAFTRRFFLEGHEETETNRIDFSKNTPTEQLQESVRTLLSSDDQSIRSLRTIRIIIYIMLHRLKDEETSFGLSLSFSARDLEIGSSPEMREKQLEIGSGMVASYAKNCGIITDIAPDILQVNLVSILQVVSEQYLNTEDNCGLSEGTKTNSIASRKTIYDGYDWFVAIIFLLYEGDEHQILNFFSEFAQVPELLYIWFKRGRMVSRNGKHPANTLSRSVEYLLRAEYPMAYNSLYLRGISPHVIVHRWLQQFFLNYLNFADIAALLAVLTTYGIDFLAYFCAMLINHLSKMSRAQTSHYEDYSRESWKYELSCPIVGFKLRCSELQEMRKLEAKYKRQIMDMLQDMG